MTEVQLICHAQSDSNGIEDIDVTIAHGASGQITVMYRVSGEINALDIPVQSKQDRADGLWKNTCFEIFIGNFEDESYLEYNFSPSGQWAVYQFARYRSDMADVDTSAPNVGYEQSVESLTLTAKFAVPDAWRGRSLRVGISAVIATKTGDISYWAAAHPAGKPDFHHKDCFAVQLEARSGA